MINSLIKELCLEDLTYSKLHVTTSALFDINEVWLALGEQTALHYTPGSVTGPEPESPAATLLDAVVAGSVTLADLDYAYRVINRLDDVYRAQGQEL